MAEQSMLSLFDSDASFLEELASGPGGMPTAQATMEASMRPAGMPTPIGPSMQQQGTPPQYASLAQVAGQPQTPKLQHYNSGYEQYGQQAYGMGDARQGGIAQMMSTSPQQQFGSPPPGGAAARMRSPGPSTFQGYGMHGNTQVTPPQQQQPQAPAQLSMSPGGIWSQGGGMAQATKAMPSSNPYVQQQQRQQAPQGMQAYIQSHRDYSSLSTSHPAQSQMSRFPSQQNQMYGRPTMGSPTPSQRLSHMPMANASAMNPNASQYPVTSQTGMLRTQGPVGMHSTFSTGTARPGVSMMPQGSMQQQGMNAGMQMAGGRAAFGYPGQPQPQQSSMIPAQQGGIQLGQMPSNGPMSPYQSQSSGQNTYRQPFPGTSQPTNIPHPIQPSQSQTPTSQYMAQNSGTTAQGLHSQTGMTHQPFSSYGSGYLNRTSGNLNQPSGVSGIYGSASNTSGLVTVASASSSHVVSSPLAVNTSTVIPSQTSPVMTPNMQALEMEIQQLQNQVQQLYQMPQTPETQQKMLDLQERARTLRATQQQQMMLQQRTQQQQMLSPTASVTGMPTSVQQKPAGPGVMVRPQMPQQHSPVSPVQQAPTVAPAIRQPAPMVQQVQQVPRIPMQQGAPSPGLPAMVQNVHMQPLPQQPQPAIVPQSVATPTPPPQLPSIESELVLPFGLDQQPQLPVSAPAAVDQQSLISSQPVTPTMPSMMDDDSPLAFSDGIPFMDQNQDKGKEKSQKIMEEAIAKAKLEGRDIPPIGIPTTVEGAEEEVKEKKKKKPRKKKEETGDKPPKEKKERKPKKPKEPKSPKEPKAKKSKGKKAGATPEKEVKVEGGEVAEGEKVEGEAAETEEVKPKPEKKKTPARPNRPKKKKPPATFLKKIKKRKRNESSGSEAEVGPAPPSPEDDGIEKRRSGRVTKRKKYLDDLDLNLSDEDAPKGKAGSNDTAPILQPVQFFVDNPSEEESQVVEKILGVRFMMRKFKRIIEKPIAQETVKLETQEETNETEVNIMDASITDDQGQAEGKDTPADEMKPEPSSKYEGDDVQKRPEEEGKTKDDENPDKPEDCTADETPVDKEEEDTTAPPTEAAEAEPEIPAVGPEAGTKGEAAVKVTEEEPETEEYEEDVEEFFVKYKNFSYLHCEWRTADELELGDKRIHQKIKRFRIKRNTTSIMFMFDEEELFNPDYVEVDRLLDVSMSTDPISNETVTHYLVKWRSLPYEDSTWELATDVDNQKIEEFQKFRILPSEEEREYKARPKSAQWKKLEESPAYKNGNVLRGYQLEGISWLTFCYYNKQNCILADEMGLGKTIQSISFLHQIVEYGIRGPFLVIAPLSTITNWQREFETWTDLNAIVYHGSSASRSMIQEYELYYRDEDRKIIPDVYRFHAIITTYEMIITDLELLSQIDWRCAVIDEAHRLKNKKCKLADGLKLFDLEHRVLLTGTPLQNNVEELFGLLNFLEPTRFNSTEAFLTEFGELKTESQVDKLKALLKPMMLRRLKEDVEKNIAAKEETIIEVELTNVQKKYYRAILERNFGFLAKGSTSMANVPNLMNTMMELRKCCNHPYLVKGAEEKIHEEMKQALAHLDISEGVFQSMVQSCGKLVLLDKLLPKLKAGGHKVLIFSQMIRVLDILEDYLIHRHYIYERLDGRIRGNIRQEAIDRFSKPDSDRFVFLLCTRAGGLGINLTAADTVIIYDSDWNPQNDLQAQARCHRIGQEKMVKVYRLITTNSYEREMFDRASLKLGLDKAVLQSMAGKENGNPQQQMSKKEVEELLRKGAYGALMEDDTAGDQFCEEDIDQILQRRTQVIQIESEGKGSTFSKASFSMSDNRTDIDIDDPNFWQKWAKKADLDADYLLNRNELIIEQPRVRKQTSRFGGHEPAELEVSDVDTDDSEYNGDNKKGRKGGKRRPRNREEDFEFGEEIVGPYLRAECFKVEKHLLVYGWSRWEAILAHGRFKRKMETKDVETISKAMLLYSLQHYHGDERIKGFIWDLVTTQEGEEKDYRNHSGLSAPVPRGRKGKKRQKEVNPIEGWDLSKCEVDPDEVLVDEGYKKHLKRHANKVLLRVRLLYYMKEEIFAEQAEKVFTNATAGEIDIPPPCPDGDPPVYWWDEEADKSLLIGVLKHGYEKYNIMRQDPALCFLERCGPPDSAALLKEQNDEDNPSNDVDEEPAPTPKRRRGRPPLDEDYDMYMDSSQSPSVNKTTPPPPPPPQSSENGKLPFPGSSELNTRLRRVITGYQRNYKKQQLKQAQRAKKMERREKIEIAVKERELVRRSQQQNRWSRREEADFYRVVSTFGVERDRKTGQYVWDTFRSIARLDKKYDDTLTEYFFAFYHMCKRVCRKFKDEKEVELYTNVMTCGAAIPPSNMPVEPITEERAGRCLARIDLLNKIREHILWHPKLKERLKLCAASYDMPEWWQAGDHDLDLLIGAAKHGLSRTDFHILHDPKLCFKDIVKLKQEELNSMYMSLRNRGADSAASTPSKSDIKTESVLDNEPEPGELIRESPVKHESPTKPSTPSKVVTPSKVPVENSECKTPVKASNSRTPERQESEKSEKESNSKSPAKDSTPVKCETAERTCGETQERTSVNGETDVKDEPGCDTEDASSSDSKVVSEDTSSANGVKSEPSGEDIKEAAVKEEVQEELKEEEDELDLSKPPELKPELPMPELKPAHAGSGQEEEKLLSKFERSMYPGLDAGFLEPEPGEITSADMMARAMGNPALQWPKDRVIFHRLENVCQCIETGEWPLKRASMPFPLRQDGYSDSRASTPSGTPSGTPLPDTPGDRSETPDSGLDRAAKVKGLRRPKHVDTTDDDSERDFRVHVAEPSDGLKMTFQKKKGRRRRRDLEEEGGRVSELVNMPSDCDSESNMSGLQSETDMLPNGATFPFSMSPRAQLEEQMERRTQMLIQQQIQHQQQQAAAAMQASAAPGIMDMLPKKKRGRKRKMDKLLEEQAAALMAAQAAQKAVVMQPDIDLDAHVPVINIETGQRLSGEDAPTRRELPLWLEQNPGYMVEQSAADDEFEPGMIDRRKKRRPRVDPYKLDLDNLTGEENVSVINKETGKKITGAKAPPLKYLKQWLEQNPAYNVDPKWAHVVRARANMPEEMMKARVPEPHERRGRRSSSSSLQSMMGDYASYAASMGAFPGLASPLMAGGFPKMPFPMAYGGLSQLSLASMYGMGSSYGLLAGAMGGKSGEESEDKEAGEEGESPSKSKASSSASSTAPHPSFPFMYNPMLFNPLLAQGMGSFSLPSSLPTSFATLAQAGSSSVNGVEDSDAERPTSDTEPASQVEQDVAQDLSMKKSSPRSTSSTPRKERKHKHPVKVAYNPEQIDEPMNLSSKPASKPKSSQEAPPKDPPSEDRLSDSEAS